MTTLFDNLPQGVSPILASNLHIALLDRIRAEALALGDEANIGDASSTWYGQTLHTSAIVRIYKDQTELLTTAMGTAFRPRSGQAWELTWGLMPTGNSPWES